MYNKRIRRWLVYAIHRASSEDTQTDGDSDRSKVFHCSSFQEGNNQPLQLTSAAAFSM
jgi:hypothetical protein